MRGRAISDPPSDCPRRAVDLEGNCRQLYDKELTAVLAGGTLF